MGTSTSSRMLILRAFLLSYIVGAFCSLANMQCRVHTSSTTIEGGHAYLEQWRRRCRCVLTRHASWLAADCATHAGRLHRVRYFEITNKWGVCLSHFSMEIRILNSQNTDRATLLARASGQLVNSISLAASQSVVGTSYTTAVVLARMFARMCVLRAHGGDGVCLSAIPEHQFCTFGHELSWLVDVCTANERTNRKNQARQNLSWWDTRHVHLHSTTGWSFSIHRKTNREGRQFLSKTNILLWCPFV
jgi:hypothetical protein